ncbi:MAG: secretion system protein E, partial [Haloferacaceae archaeon]
VQDVYQWQAETDEFLQMGQSNTLEGIKFDRGWTQERLDQEIFKRRVVLAYLVDRGLNTYTQVAATFQAFINDQETILALMAKDELERSLEDLREMESVLIDIDPEQEAMVPRPDPEPEEAEQAREILERAEEELFPDYRDRHVGEVATALADVDHATDVEVSGNESASEAEASSDEGFEAEASGDESTSGADVEASSGESGPANVDLSPTETDVPEADSTGDASVDDPDVESGTNADAGTANADRASGQDADEGRMADDPFADAFDGISESGAGPEGSASDERGDAGTGAGTGAGDGADSDSGDSGTHGSSDVAESSGTGGDAESSGPDTDPDGGESGGTESDDDLDDWGFGEVSGEGEE